MKSSISSHLCPTYSSDPSVTRACQGHRWQRAHHETSSFHPSSKMPKNDGVQVSRQAQAGPRLVKRDWLAVSSCDFEVPVSCSCRSQTSARRATRHSAVEFGLSDSELPQRASLTASVGSPEILPTARTLCMDQITTTLLPQVLGAVLDGKVQQHSRPKNRRTEDFQPSSFSVNFVYGRDIPLFWSLF